MNENQKLSASQYVYLIVALITASVLILSFMDGVFKQDAWLVVLGGFVASIPIILSYTTLMRWFPGKNLIEISDLVFGRYVGKIVSVLFIVQFINLVSLNSRDLANFYAVYVMPETPKAVFAIAFLLLCAYAVKKGLAAIAKASLFTVLFSVFAVVLTFLFLLGNMDFTNFLPVFELAPSAYLKAVSNFMIVPFGELMVLMMVMPAVAKTKKLSRLTLIGVSLGTLMLFAISIRNTAVLGASSSLFSMASYQSARMIDLGEFFSRVELLIGMGFTMVLFSLVSTLYYATVKSLAQIFSLHSYAPLILPVGGIAIVLALTFFDSSVSHLEFALKYDVPFFGIFEFFLPLLTLFIAWIRRSIHKAIRTIAGVESNKS